MGEALKIEKEKKKETFTLLSFPQIRFCLTLLGYVNVTLFQTATIADVKLT